MCFGIFTFPSTNIFARIHGHYGSQSTSQTVEVDFHLIDFTKSDPIELVKNYSFPTDCTFSGTMGRISRVSSEKFIVVWGDTSNNNYVECSLNDHSPLMKLQNCSYERITQDYFVSQNVYFTARAMVGSTIN